MQFARHARACYDKRAANAVAGFQLIKLHSHKSATHWGSFSFIAPAFAWRRTGVYRLEGMSADGTIFHFRTIPGDKQIWQPGSLLSTSTFRPIAYDGGKSK